MQASLLTNLMLPLALGVIMLGLGLGLTVEDFRRVARYPRAVLVGLALQTLLLPWVAFGLALAFRLPPELAVGLMLLAEYAHMITTSFLMVILFWGGWSFFGLENVGQGTVWEVLVRFAILGTKMFAFVFLFLLVRWTIPRFRFDQLMGLAWKVMIPLAILHMLAAMIVRQFELPLWTLTLLSVGLFVAAGLIAARSGGPNNRPRKLARPLPIGVPEGVTYVPR